MYIYQRVTEELENMMHFVGLSLIDEVAKSGLIRLQFKEIFYLDKSIALQVTD